MRFYDLQGQEQNASWLAENYGTVFTQGRSTYRAAELREAEGEPVLTVTVRKDGEVQADVEVECFFFGYETGMLTGRTSNDGTVTFPLPREFTYKLTGQGTHWLNIDGLRLIGLGVPEGVPGWRHLNVVIEEDDVEIYDKEGNRRDEAWLRETYGLVGFEGSFIKYRIKELRDIEGPTAFLVTVLKKDGTPKVNVPVQFTWGTDGKDPLQHTNVDGIASHTAGGGAYYHLPGPGPHQEEIDGDIKITGLGWPWGTNHQHLNVTFIEAGDEPPPSPPPPPQPPPPPPPPPPDDFQAQVLAHLESIIVLLEEIAAQGR